jgi:hypothetical protein
MAVTEKKITKRDRFEEIKTLLADNADIVAFCDNEIALLDDKADKAKARAAKKKADGDALQDEVAALLTGDFQTIDAIMEGITDAEATKAKVQARLTKLVNAGVAIKDQVTVEVDGKKVKRMAYSIANAGDAE